MKKSIILFLLVIICSPILHCQTIDYNEEIQLKVKEAFHYIYQQAQDNSSDILILKTNFIPNYFFLVSVEEDIIKTKEVIMPKHKKYKENIVEIHIDSITDVFWIKKNKFQNVLVSNFENPFRLKTRFQDEKISSFQKEIKNLERQKNQELKEKEIQAYYTMIKEKYPDIVIRNVETIQEGFSNTPDGSVSFSSIILYPQMARENGTQGIVRIGFVITKDCQALDFFVFKSLPHGCTEAVIKAVKEASQQLKEQNIIKQDNEYIEADIRFTLQ